MSIKKTYCVERGLITKLLETKDMVLVKDLQIKSFFFTGESRKVFSYLSDYFNKNGEVPTLRVFKTQFPNYHLETYIDPTILKESIGTEESLKHWCEEVRTKTRHNKMAESTEGIAEFIEQGESEKAYELMKKTVLHIESDIIESTTVDITQDIEDRKKIYLERKAHQGMIGIPMGIDKLDFILKGSQKKTLTTMIAQTGIGKPLIA